MRRSGLDLRALARDLATTLLATLAACSGGADPSTAVDLLERVRVDRGGDEAVDLGACGPHATEHADWYAGDRHDDGATWSWSRSRTAAVPLPIERPRDGRILVRVSTLAYLQETQELAVELNGEPLGVAPVTAQQAVLAFPVAAEALVAGRNELSLQAASEGAPSEHGDSRDTRRLSIACDWVGFVADGAPDPAPNRYPSASDRGDAASPLGLVPGQRARLRAYVPPLGGLELLARATAGEPEVRIAVSAVEPGAAPFSTTRRIGPAASSVRLELGELSRRVCDLELSVVGGELDLEGLGVFGDGPRNDVVLIIVDTLRADHVFDEDETIDTPALDALAAGSVVFRSTYAHAPMTLPSTTALFSSRTPHVAGVTNNGVEVPTDLPLLAEWLRTLGYHTAAVTSIGTLYPLRPEHGLDRGFDRFEHAPFDLPRAEDSLPWMKRLVADLEDEEPFFLLCHFSDPHGPYNSHGVEHLMGTVRFGGAEVARQDIADMKLLETEVEVGPERPAVLELSADAAFQVRRLDFHVPGPDGRPVPLEYTIEAGAKTLQVETFRAAVAVPEGVDRVGMTLWWHQAVPIDEVPERYEGEVEYVDRRIGELLDELRARGLYDDALIVFTADHGEHLGRKHDVGHVQTLYDGLLHVPLFIKLPRGHVLADALAERAGHLARHLDVVPTILDLLDLPELPGQMGTSLLRSTERLHFAETRTPEAERDLVALRNEHYKLIFSPSEDRFELYDLVADPDEEVDLFPTRGAEFADWQADLRALAAEKTPGGPDRDDPELRARLEALGYAE